MNDFEAVINRFAELAIEEIERMADAALIELGFTSAFVNRSRGQKRRFRQRDMERKV